MWVWMLKLRILFIFEMKWTFCLYIRVAAGFHFWPVNKRVSLKLSVPRETDTKTSHSPNFLVYPPASQLICTSKSFYKWSSFLLVWAPNRDTRPQSNLASPRVKLRSSCLNTVRLAATHGKGRKQRRIQFLIEPLLGLRMGSIWFLKSFGSSLPFSLQVLSLWRKSPLVRLFLSPDSISDVLSFTGWHFKLCHVFTMVWLDITTLFIIFAESKDGHEKWLNTGSLGLN